MEVHAHTHTPRKKWTHYFWEFLMLFLAVFCMVGRGVALSADRQARFNILTTGFNPLQRWK